MWVIGSFLLCFVLELHNSQNDHIVHTEATFQKLSTDRFSEKYTEISQEISVMESFRSKVAYLKQRYLHKATINHHQKRKWYLGFSGRWVLWKTRNILSATGCFVEFMSCFLYWNKMLVPNVIFLKSLIKTLKKEPSPGSSLKFRFTLHRAGLSLKDMELILKRVRRSLNSLVNKEETKLLKFFLIYIKNYLHQRKWSRILTN